MMRPSTRGLTAAAQDEDQWNVQKRKSFILSRDAKRRESKDAPLLPPVVACDAMGLAQPLVRRNDLGADRCRLGAAGAEEAAARGIEGGGEVAGEHHPRLL